jgi:hypothetical protein
MRLRCRGYARLHDVLLPQWPRRLFETYDMQLTPILGYPADRELVHSHVRVTCAGRAMPVT